MSTSRIYLVTVSGADRLVRATHPATALMHVAKDIAKVQVASQQHIFDCAKDGVEIENATPEQQRLPD